MNGARAAIWTLIKIKAVSPLAASAAAFFGSCYATGFLNRVLEFSIKNERKAVSPLAASAAFFRACKKCYCFFLNRVLEFSIKNAIPAVSPLAASVVNSGTCNWIF